MKLVNRFGKNHQKTLIRTDVFLKLKTTAWSFSKLHKLFVISILVTELENLAIQYSLWVSVVFFSLTA